MRDIKFLIFGTEHFETSKCFNKELLTPKNDIMKKLLFSLLLFAITISSSMAQKAVFEKESKMNFQETLDALKENAAEKGWAIPAEHDMQAILKKKDKSVLPSTILVLCNAEFAYALLKDDESRKAQTLLPCRVAVYEKEDGKTYVAWSNYEEAGEKVTPKAEDTFKGISEGLKEITSTVTK